MVPFAATILTVACTGKSTAALQPVQRLAPTTAPTNTSICRRFRFLQPKQQSKAASAESWSKLPERELEAGFDGLTVTVSVEEAVVAPDVVMVAGENEQVAHEGNPEQDREVFPVKPLCGTTVTVTVPVFPGDTASDPGQMWTEKLGVPAGRVMV